MPNNKDFIVKNNARVRGGKIWLKDTSTDADPPNQQHVYIDGSDGNLTLASDNLIEFHETDGATRRVVFDCNDNKYSFGDSTSHGSTDAQSEMFQVSGSGRFTSTLNVNGSILGRVSSAGTSNQNSGNSHSLVNNVFLNPSPEAGGAIDIRTFNELAGFNTWGNISSVSGFFTTRSGSSGSYSYSNEVTSITSGNMFDGAASTLGSHYTNDGADGTGTGTGTFTLDFDGKKALTYTCYVGIVFGSQSFRARRVKIETYRNGAWQTECDLTNNADVNVMRRVANNNANGVSKIRYTIGGGNSDGGTGYFRIQDVYAVPYNVGANSGPKGVHFLRGYGNSNIYGDLTPATDSTYDLGSSSKFFSGIYSDKLYLNDVATGTGTSALFLEGTEVKKRTLGSLAFSSTNFLTADVNDSTSAKITFSGAYAQPIEIIRDSVANAGIKFQNTSNGSANHTAYLGLGTANGEINIGTTADVRGAGNRITTVADKLNAFAATTSAELAGTISDETGTGLLVFGTNPTLVGATVTDAFVQNTANKNFITSGKQITDLDSVWSNGVTYQKNVGIQPFRYQGDASNMPTNSSGNNANWGLNIYSHGGTSESTEAYGLQLSGRDTDEDALYLRRSSNGTFGSWRKVHHEGSLPEATLQKRTSFSTTLTKGSYARVARVTGNDLGSTISVSFSGVCNNAVVAVIADIIVNHSGDIHIMSQSSDYHPITIKVFSNDPTVGEDNGDEDFDLYVKYDGGGTVASAMSLKTVIQGLGDETIVSNPTQNDHAAYTSGTSHEHTTTDGGVNFTQSSGNADIVTDGNVTATNFLGAATSAGTSTHVTVTDNESTDEENLITFVENAQSGTGSHGLEMDGNLTYNPSSGTVTATNFSGTASLATNVTITDNNEENATHYLTFVDGATGSQGLETEGKLYFTPSTGTLNTTQLHLKNAVSNGPRLFMELSAANPENNDVIGGLDFNAKNTEGSGALNYASVEGAILDETAGSIDGKLLFRVTKDNSTTFTPLTLTGTVATFGTGITAGDSSFGDIASGDITLSKTDSSATTITPNLNIKRVGNPSGDFKNLGGLNFIGDNSANEATTYGVIYGFVEDDTNGTEDGRVYVGTMKDGTITSNSLTIDSDGITVDNRITFIGSDATSNSTSQYNFAIKDEGDTYSVLRAGNNLQISAYGYRVYEKNGSVNGSLTVGVTTSGLTFANLDHVTGDSSSDYRIDLRSNGANSVFPRSLQIGRAGNDNASIFPYQNGAGSLGTSSKRFGFAYLNSMNIYDRLTIRDNEFLSFGNSQGGDVSMFYDATNNHLEMEMENDSVLFKITDNADSRFTFIKSSGEFTASGNITAFSDQRLKSEIKTLDPSKTLQMRGVEFIKDGKKGSGVIAQELEKVAPELVLDNDSGYKSVAYGNLTGYLIETVKEQQKQIDELKELVQKLLEK